MIRRTAISVCNALPRVMVTGGLGQIGTDLSLMLLSRFGVNSVLVCDVVEPSPDHPLAGKKVFEKLDCLDRTAFETLVRKFRPDWLYHLPAIMSVRGEAEPELALSVNTGTILHALNLSNAYNVRVCIPSTIAVFGDKSGTDMVADDTVLNPSTLYGVTKLYMEQLGTWWARKYGVDFRTVRLPGIVAPSLPGGGTTDYVIHMYHCAVVGKKYTCPLLPDEALPMLYMTDALNSIIKLMEAPRNNLTRTVYNITGFSLTPAQLRCSIERHTGHPLDVEYVCGPEQQIARTWPNTLDDTNARRDWGHAEKFDLDATTAEVLRLIPSLR
ncbi:L-threonine 3-dehydrogenase [Trypanosoma vivax]|nr:L-threonine 3-dehydrogenase [Trypanosoma vivax]